MLHICVFGYDSYTCFLRFFKSIDDAYTHANRTLLSLLLRDQQLIPRLRSLKRYFFLSHSSFLTHLLDLSSTELRKPAKSASLVKLQSLLDLALNSDAEAVDALFREDVKVTMSSSGLYEWLLKVVSVSGAIGEEGEGDGHGAEDGKKEKDKERDEKKQQILGMLCFRVLRAGFANGNTAIDALTLDYTVKFPLSLVISRKTILRYQLIFRFLLHLRHVEQSLSAMWIEQKTTPWRRPPSSHPGEKDTRDAWTVDFENWRKRVFLLRARMLAFVQQILAFATSEVLEPNWRKLEDKLEGVGGMGAHTTAGTPTSNMPSMSTSAKSKSQTQGRGEGAVETVDQLLRDHVDFLDTCLKACMLTSSRLLRVRLSTMTQRRNMFLII